MRTSEPEETLFNISLHVGINKSPRRVPTRTDELVYKTDQSNADAVNLSGSETSDDFGERKGGGLQGKLVVCVRVGWGLLEFCKL